MVNTPSATSLVPATLSAAGFDVGDDVIISFIVTVSTIADSPCDAAFGVMELYVDNVELSD